MSAYIESDSMAPDPMMPGRRLPRDLVALDLQLSINQKLMDRLDALERKVKELEHRQAV